MVDPACEGTVRKSSPLQISDKQPNTLDTRVTKQNTVDIKMHVTSHFKNAVGHVRDMNKCMIGPVIPSVPLSVE